ncbi:MAG: glycoside hydrolase family 3 C-terminal domain-containing protein [candidate division KSB1 bacterium]|nr:glycoside hydrolase family 3 C-terminal domain-containing protein [candidate division KSB1 bacterium]MDZ7300561.1 glycoside hydrolase family 3 C-terminal domain-containing protein [candidate division KSB1 bacterium]MDZ7309699.1 glycoside hydrolase family 3 C-terminal domain-containing protein [candidate division KSB1 bacterium]
MRIFKFMFVFLFISLVAFAGDEKPKYKNSALPIEERVEDLIKRMTLEEKVGQLVSFFARDTSAFDDNGNFVSPQDTAILNRGVGAFSARSLWRSKSARHRAQCINGIQKYMLEKTRLGIPVLMFSEALHGLMIPGATSFPQAIALGSTWDTTLVEQIFAVAAREGRSRGTRQVLSPVLDLARDPRWGRTEECYSEDPYLVSRLGMAAVFGFQGRGKILGKNNLAVTLKHFAGHGQSEGGRNIAPVNYSERVFRETHLYPFEMAIKRAHALSVMASYNEWDGVPNHVNRKLLTDILRQEWGFNGYVMSDGGGMDVTWRDHRAAADMAESGVLSVMAGIDFELGSGACFRPLVDQVRKGNLSEEHITRAAKNVLRVKFTAGLFDDPYIDLESMDKVYNTQEHKALALEAAHEAMVLLKNENNTLPFDAAEIKTLAVIGPNAPDIHLGGYSPWPMQGVSVLQGMREFAGGKFKVIYAEGCKLTLNKECHWQVNENPILGDPETDRKLIAEAVKVAQQSDAVVLVLGENELLCREAWSESHLGDRDNLDLVGRQNELAEAIFKTGKPVVVLLINGRPITINYLQQNAPAIIECWYLGQETGHAVADVIFGKVNPSGKLPVTFPRSVGQLPCYYNKKPSLFREYVLAESTPLYPFGFGMSYTTFEYKNLKITPAEIPVGGTAEVTVEVTNTGKMKGDEIVQLYIHDVISLPTRPVKELKDFARITLNPGETKTVKFTFAPEKLEAFDLDMKRVVQPGEFEIMVGKNSVEVLMDTLTVK